MTKINTDKLIIELQEAAKAYYQGADSVMTDNEYDTKLEFLESLVDQGKLELTDELSELLYDSVSAGSTPEGTTVTHDHPMLSLGKAKNSDELLTYHERLVKNGATGFTLQMKFDGMAMSAKYVDGKLTQLATRGDGVQGELLTHLIDNDHITILGLPKTTQVHEDFELRGELYMTDTQFVVVNADREKATGEKFSNSRNATTGIVKRSAREMDYDATLTFTAYSAFQDGVQVDFENLMKTCDEIVNAETITKNEAKELCVDKDYTYLEVCEVDSLDFADLELAVERFGKLREQFDAPTDGVVIKPKNEMTMLNKLGFTSHHPIANVAFKYPGTKSITTVEEITYTVGKTGKLTPRARVIPVDVDGVTIEFLSCHNFNWLHTMNIRVGATVAVTRANDVIPAIDSVIDAGPNELETVMTHCPECGELLTTDGLAVPKTLICDNLACSSRFSFYMKSVVGRDYLYIDSLGEVLLEGLIDAKVITSLVDLFDLDEETLATTPTGLTSTGNVRMVGPGNAANIIASINNAKLNTDSNKLLASLNFEGMGPNTAKRLIKHFGGIQQVLDADIEDLRNAERVGNSLVESFYKHKARAVEQFNELLALGVKINDPVVNDNAGAKGSFSVSGSVEGFANRGDFVEHMEALGWEFHKSPKKDTTVLFADPNGTSSKIKKARTNGTRIIDRIEDL